ncbi:MAG: T9SS type A sorting domain-containing protein, partial [Crocinitomicaceae bacterium]|nr:T9SS type A sorting domain-containing protein [Crocinitomicaceae bacterium]
KSSSALVMNSPVTVSGALTMTEGNINNGSNILTIGESSAIPGAITHSSGSVTGKLRRYFADASSSSKYFPIGNASKTRDVTVNFAASPGSNQFLTASYNAGYPQLSGADLYAGLPLTTSDGQLIQNYDDEGYWEISPGSSATGTGDSYSADINSEDYTLSIHMNGLTGDNAASMDRSKVRIIKSAGPSHTSWVALTHNAATCIGGVDADNNYSVTAAGSGFSFFGAGTEDDNALPVELVSFNGVCNEGVVDLVWQTASEHSSEDFEVAYSRDGVDWKTIHTEPAAGFSNTLLTYNYTHNGAVSGNNYYRLTQNDIDGASVVYDNLILNANCQSDGADSFSVFPNPSSGNFQILVNNPFLEGSSELRVIDLNGRIVLSKPLEIKSGMNLFVINELFQSGVYYLKIVNGQAYSNVLKQIIR